MDPGEEGVTRLEMATSTSVPLRGVTSHPSSPLSRAFSVATATEARITACIFVVVVLLGVSLGFSTDTASFLSTVPGAWPRVSNVIGWTYFSAWSISFWPQILQNFRRGTVSGLSFDFLALNLLGFTCYSIYNCSQYWNATVIAQFKAANGGKTPGVHANDVFFGIHAVAVTALTIAQCAVLKRAPGQGVSRVATAAIAALLVGGCAYAGAVAAGKGGSWWDFVLVVSYVKLAISCCKYVPQAVLNWRRGSTAGWNIHNVLLDFTGGLLSVLQQCGDAQATGDWGSVVGGNPVKFGLGFVRGRRAARAAPPPARARALPSPPPPPPPFPTRRLPCFSTLSSSRSTTCCTRGRRAQTMWSGAPRTRRRCSPLTAACKLTSRKRRAPNYSVRIVIIFGAAARNHPSAPSTPNAPNPARPHAPPRRPLAAPRPQAAAPAARRPRAPR